MQQFEIILKNEKIKGYQFLATLLVFINLAVFIFLLSSDVKRWPALAALFFSFTYFTLRFFKARKSKNKNYTDGIIFLILALCWVLLQNYLPALACIVIAGLYQLAMQKLKFVFNEEKVEKSNFPKTAYNWNAFSNVMIRDNILTLDLVNNKLIQVEIENEESVDELQFNEFAKQHIHSQKQLLT
ncbi:MAG: hypothetical protein ABI683_08285 [Ginsengibacter sp.]